MGPDTDFHIGQSSQPESESFYGMYIGNKVVVHQNSIINYVSFQPGEQSYVKIENIFSIHLNKDEDPVTIKVGQEPTYIEIDEEASSLGINNPGEEFNVIIEWEDGSIDSFQGWWNEITPLNSHDIKVYNNGGSEEIKLKCW